MPSGRAIVDVIGALVAELHVVGAGDVDAAAFQVCAPIQSAFQCSARGRSGRDAAVVRAAGGGRALFGDLNQARDRCPAARACSSSDR